MKAHKPFLEYTVLLVIITAAIVLYLQIKNQDINLCRYIFSSLVKARYAGERFIDWENLKAVGVDVGATYTKLPNEKERLGYKKAFIKNFSLGFSRAGGRLELFTHWRIYERDGGKVIVAVDYLGHHKTLLFTVSKLGKSKLVSLQWR